MRARRRNVSEVTVQLPAVIPSVAPGALRLRQRVARRVNARVRAWMDRHPLYTLGAIEAAIDAAVGPRGPRTRHTPLYLASAPLWDAEGRRYQVVYRILCAALDGSGPVLPSNKPHTFGPVPGYLPAFQARDLDTPPERAKIATIAKNLDPERLTSPSADPTIGAPVVWRGGKEGGKADSYYTLAGNGRVIALLMAPEEHYLAYVANLQDAWAGLWPGGTLPKNHRYILVREVYGDCVGGETSQRCSPLTFDQAVKLAAASQQSTAGVESAIGAAIGRLRSLGLTDLSTLPPFEWARYIDEESVVAFKEYRRNNAFWVAVLDRLPPEQRTAMSDEASAELLQDIMAGFIPDETRRSGIGGIKAEEALLTVMPGALSVQALIDQGKLSSAWSIMDVLADAVAFSKLLKRRRTPKRGNAINRLLDEADRQVSTAGLGTSLLAGIRGLGILVGWLLYKSAGRADPTQLASQWMTEYLEEAAKAEGGGQAGLSLGGGYRKDPLDTMSGIVGLSLPRGLRSR